MTKDFLGVVDQNQIQSEYGSGRKFSLTDTKMAKK